MIAKAFYIFNLKIGPLQANLKHCCLSHTLCNYTRGPTKRICFSTIFCGKFQCARIAIRILRPTPTFQNSSIVSLMAFPTISRLEGWNFSFFHFSGCFWVLVLLLFYLIVGVIVLPFIILYLVCLCICYPLGCCRDNDNTDSPLFRP